MISRRERTQALKTRSTRARVWKPCPAIIVWLDPFSVQTRTMMVVVGYARVSTRGQTLDTQRGALRAEGCERVWCKFQSLAQNQRVSIVRYRR